VSGKNLDFAGGFCPAGSVFLAGGFLVLVGPLADATPQDDDSASRTATATATAMPARLRPIIIVLAA
jgi:hypothetical protein